MQGILSLMLLTVTIFYSKLVCSTNLLFGLPNQLLNFLFPESDKFVVRLSTYFVDAIVWLLYVRSTGSE